MPGGFGAAVNLSTWASEQENCSVNEDLKESILQFHKQGKPIGATCITPALLGKVFEKVAPVKLTLGSNASSNEGLKKMGMEAVSSTAAEMVADEENKVFTTPCYMEPADLAGMYEGIKKVVARLG
jgi:enhancing lycopene biosynthesis protein 2